MTPGFVFASASTSCLRMPSGVGHARVLANPDAVVDHSSEIFDEVAIDLGRDAANRFVREEPRRGIPSPGRAGPGECGDGGRCGGTLFWLHGVWTSYTILKRFREDLDPTV